MKINPSLKLVWYGLIVLVTIIPVLILAPWIGSKLKTLMLENTLLREQEVVYHIGDDIEDEIARLISVLQNTSGVLYLTEDPVKMRQILNSVLKKERYVDALHILSKDGDVVADLVNIYSDIPYYSPCNNCPIISEPMSGKIFIRPVHSVDRERHTQIAIPIGSANEIRGILLTTIDSNMLWGNMADTFARKGVTSYLVDSSGDLLVSPQGGKYAVNSSLSNLKPVRAFMSNKKWSGKETYKGVSGEEVFGVFAPVKSLNWGVVSEIPVQTITGPIRSIIYFTGVFVVIILGISIVIGMLFVRRIIEPISKLTSALHQMPEMDGYMATREIRQRAGDVSRIPIIALTASAMQEDIERCLESGMNDFISKPVKMKELKRIIKKWHAKGGQRGLSDEQVVNESLEEQKQEVRSKNQEIRITTTEILSSEDSNVLIDREGALNRMGGDEELYMDLIKLFIDNAPEQIVQLKEAIEAMDMDSAKRAAHSLKGASPNVGFVSVQQAALQAEALSVNREWEKLKDSFEYIKIEFEKVRSLLPLSKSEAG